ncbi:cryptochrome/photolyase family protein [Halomicroarcula sp. S1AR25-4]|uniref:cryptochrome/photolyase family protein n=1 Tax=Haloarcula sp. S1AR25-4 TaxID=2950538 RepID=UPI002874E9E7|nr:cryptochrome/photolyase family protein [Halomicroarcula sp. S1AR25-4]MDS0276888.1 cryptochrome/photolyase family protein [Halomicroarcula sp. S1AR25-4]
MTVWLRADHLVRRRGPLARRPDERVLLVEAESFARKLPYHPHKLTLVFAALRHFRDDLRAEGRTVDYRQVDTFEEGLTAHFEGRPDDTLVTTMPQAPGARERIERIVADAGGAVEFVPDERFLCSPGQFDTWASDGRYRHEEFYRFMRRSTGYLMDDGDPVGGEWNYDDQNRETPPDDWTPADPPTFERDETTEAVAEWVRETFDGSYDDPPYGGDWADPESFCWPVTRRQAVRALDHFVTHRLTDFGPYQDAMRGDEWAMSHSLLSTSLNLGLLLPDEVVERAIAAYEGGEAPLNSVEGFVRQVLGWREFLRHVYRREMPALADANQLGATEDVPEFYWTGETDMACLSDVVDGVRARGYSHHIERLMVLANFGLIYGVEPAQLNRWFHAGYVDAFHWVTTPNVVEMGLYGAGVFATKPYAASANYLDEMSDYCSGCPYDETKTTGEGACPFNALYWDFLDRNEDALRSNHRMGLLYTHVDNTDEEEWTEIRARADEIRRLARSGDL